MNIAVVTGCMGGIGYSTAKALIAEGYFVVGMGRRAAREFEKEIAALGDAFAYVSGDIGVSADRHMLAEYASGKGNVTLLVNVAGVAPTVRTDILEMSEESYDRVMNINTKGTLFLTQLFANIMKENEPCDGIRGRIINISSLSAYTSSVSRGEYCISKAGVSMITKLFADRLAEYGILVNEVRPGIIETEMTAAVKEKYEALIAGGLLPIARIGKPEDVSAAVLALVRLPYVTGQSIDADGGFHIRRL